MSDALATAPPLLDPEFLRKLERLALAARRVQIGITKGERNSKRRGSSVEFADYRDYVQGDDFRFVDWNIFGRLDALYLKLFREQEDLTVHLLIDASRSMAFGTPPKIQFACQLAAALGYVALCGFDHVTVETLSDETGRVLPPCRGKFSAGKFFNFLQGVETGGPTELERSCRGHVLRTRAKGVAVIVSDFFDPAGCEGALKRLMQSGSDVHVVHVLAPEEMDPELSGDLKLLDSETGGAVEISVSRDLLKRYHENRNVFCEGIRRFCLGAGIGYFLASSATPVENLLMDVFRRGGIVR